MKQVVLAPLQQLKNKVVWYFCGNSPSGAVVKQLVLIAITTFAAHGQGAPYDPLKDSLYRGYLLATIIGVVGGFIGIVVLVWQSILLRRSANAADIAAKSANKSTESLKSAERAHVDVEFVPIQAGAAIHRFNVTNFGKSPANIMIYTFARHHFPGALPENLAGFGSWSQEKHVVNQMLPVGPSVTVLEFDISHYLSDEQRSGKERAIYRGSVTYLDIFGDEHETEVVYSYQPSSSSLTNQPRYNKYT
jgi:hypothetical protein